MENLLENQAAPGELSLNALFGSNAMNTIRLQGTIKGKKVHMLVDSGSTHSFIDLGLVKQLGLIAEVVPPLLVSVRMVHKLQLILFVGTVSMRYRVANSNRNFGCFHLGVLRLYWGWIGLNITTRLLSILRREVL